MRSIETEAESIDQAIEKALQTLQVGREEAAIEILADATRGLFGFGGTKARVRATVRSSMNQSLDDVAEPQLDSRETFEAPDAAPPRESSRRKSTETAQPIPEAVAVRSKAVLTELLSHLGVSANVDVRAGEDAGTIVLDVNGDSGGLLIGRRGQTLDALEYIVNRIVSRDRDTPTLRLMIDVERYRERRREYLTVLAHRLAGKVKETGRAVTLNPMSPRDRRIVHIALQDDAAVTTRSYGDGHYRKVLIVPAEKPRRERLSRPA